MTTENDDDFENTDLATWALSSGGDVIVRSSMLKSGARPAALQVVKRRPGMRDFVITIPLKCVPELKAIVSDFLARELASRDERTLNQQSKVFVRLPRGNKRVAP